MPSILIDDLKNFCEIANRRKTSTVQWLEHDLMKVYVRKSLRSIQYARGSYYDRKTCLDIATVDVANKHHRKGYFTEFLIDAIEMCIACQWDAVYIENVIPTELAEFFEDIGFARTNPDEFTTSFALMIKHRGRVDDVIDSLKTRLIEKLKSQIKGRK